MRIRVIRPSSREQNDLLTQRLQQLRQAGHEIFYDDTERDPAWLYTAASPEIRATALMDALTEPTSDVVWAARGGYGASELIGLLDWPRLAAAKPKPLIGFSDISALHSALYTRLGWPGVHAPMPATSLWLKDDECRDVDGTFSLLEDFLQDGHASGSVALTPLGDTQPVSGLLFGGCFTVLTNMIGTKYFPQTLKGHILFLEDLDEHPGRLMRCWQQWILAGIATDLQAVVIGNLKSLGSKIPDNAPFVLDRFAHFSPVPVYHSDDFGHCCPNFPLMIGAQATIKSSKLDYTYSATLSS